VATTTGLRFEKEDIADSLDAGERVARDYCFEWKKNLA
jgi:hypothetical protein